MSYHYYWEDLEPGLELDLGSYYLSREEIIQFSKQYDPLPFHLGEDQAANTAIGVFCASGIQTMAIAQRLIVDKLLSKTALVAGMGIDKALFHHPTTADQRLKITIKITKRDKPIATLNRGRVYYQVKVYSEHNTLLFSMTAKLLILCK